MVIDKCVRCRRCWPWVSDTVVLACNPCKWVTFEELCRTRANLLVLPHRLFVRL
jgi:hypothetical protein